MTDNLELIGQIQASGTDLKEIVLSSDALDGETFDQANSILKKLLQVLNENSSDDSIVMAVFEALGAMNVSMLKMRHAQLVITLTELALDTASLWEPLDNLINSEVARRMAYYSQYSEQVHQSLQSNTSVDN